MSEQLKKNQRNLAGNSDLSNCKNDRNIIKKYIDY